MFDYLFQNKVLKKCFYHVLWKFNNEMDINGNDNGKSYLDNVINDGR